MRNLKKKVKLAIFNFRCEPEKPTATSSIYLKIAKTK